MSLTMIAARVLACNKSIFNARVLHAAWPNTGLIAQLIESLVHDGYFISTFDHDRYWPFLFIEND